MIDVQCAREMCAFDPQIVDLHRHAGLNLVLEAQVGLLHVGLVIVGLEDIDSGSTSGATDRRGTARSSDGSAALRGGILRDVCAGKVEGLHVQSVVREGGTDGDGGSAAVENAVAGANDQFLAERRPGNAEPGAEVGMIVVNAVGEDARSGKARTRVEHRRLSNQVEIVPEAEVQGEVIS